MKSLFIFLGIFLLGKGQEQLGVGVQEQLLEVEHEPCIVVQGTVPEWLEGDFVRQSCGSWGDLRDGAEPLTYIEHLFDCVSMVAAFTLSGGDVTYSAKYYNTRNYNIWSEYGQDMTQSRVAWDTVFSSYDVERAANWSGSFPGTYPGEPSVSFWLVGSDLVAVTEGVSGVHVNTSTYETIGVYQYSDSNIGQDPGTRLVGNPAHEQVDSDGRFYSVVNTFTFTGPSSGTTSYLIYEIIDGERVPVASHEVGVWDVSLCPGYPEPYPDTPNRPGYMHSFAITENYILLPVTSYLVDMCHLFVYGGTNPGPFFRDGVDFVAEQESKILVFDKSSGQFLAEVLTDAYFVTHQFNAFERDGMIQLDMLTYPDASVYTQYTFMDSMLSPEQPLWNAGVERFSIQTSDWSLTRNVLTNPANAEFSGKNEAYNGIEYTYGYMVTGIWTEVEPSRIVKVNMETGEQMFWEAAATHFPQEPIFVPRPGATEEDDGVLVVGGFNAETEKGFMTILDAVDMSFIAEVEAPLLTPIGIHSRFYPAGTFEP